jgi:hypothetical protein
MAALLRRVSLMMKAMATNIHTTTATQIMNRLSGPMKLRPATFPNDRVATLYMPKGKTMLHRVGS